jgi:hypothetical protein
MRLQQFPVVFSPGLATDLAAMDGHPAAPGQTTMAQQARTVIARLGGGDMLGAPLATLGDAALEGCRVVAFDTPASRAERHGRGELVYQLHPAVRSEFAPLVVQVVAAAHVTDDRSGRQLRSAASNRLSPGEGRLALAYSTGVRQDIEALTSDPAARRSVLAAVNGLAEPGGPDPLAGEELWIADRLDLRGYRRTVAHPAAADGQALQPVSVVHRMLPPAGQSRINVVQIAAVGPTGTPAAQTAAAIRLKRANPAGLQQSAAAARTPPQTRASAAAARSTTGGAPKAGQSAPATAAARRQAQQERERRVNGL